MQRILGLRARVADDTGTTTPTPLFLAYVSSLALSGAAALRGGVSADAMADFLLLAALVSGTVPPLSVWVGAFLWSTIVFAIGCLFFMSREREFAVRL